MKKTVLFLSLVFLASLSVAQPTDTMPEDTPEPDQAPPDNIGERIGALPGQASDTAKQVVDTIRNQFRNGFEGVGDALRNMFQDRQGNQTVE